MQEMVNALPVAHMVEALLTLLGQGKPEPPTWLKEKAGRMLSKLLLREGGVAASMERLVGGIQEVINMSISICVSFVKNPDDVELCSFREM